LMRSQSTIRRHRWCRRGRERHSGPRSRRVTLVDLADAIGLHPSTVSRALDPRSTHLVSGATLERVRDAAATLGYRGISSPARCGGVATDTIGVVVADLRNTVVTSILKRARPVVGSCGVSHHDRGERRKLE